MWWDEKQVRNLFIDIYIREELPKFGIGGREDDVTRSRVASRRGARSRTPKSGQECSLLSTTTDHLLAMRKTSYAIAFLLVAALLAVVSVRRHTHGGGG